MSSRITNRLRPLVTSYLRARRGWGLMGALLGLIDSLVQAQEDAVAQSLILRCSDDALDAHASNSNDRRALIEDADALRAYLATRWDRKKEAGTEDGLRFQLARHGYPVVDLVCERDLREAGIVGAFGGKVGYSFVVLRLPNRWGGGAEYDDGSLWDGGALWGTGISADALAELRFVLRKWSPAGVSFRFVVQDLDGTTAWDAAGFSGNYMLVPLNEEWEYRTGGPLIPDYNTGYLTP